MADQKAGHQHPKALLARQSHDLDSLTLQTDIVEVAHNMSDLPAKAARGQPGERNAQRFFLYLQPGKEMVKLTGHQPQTARLHHAVVNLTKVNEPVSRLASSSGTVCKPLCPQI